RFYGLGTFRVPVTIAGVRDPIQLANWGDETCALVPGGRVLCWTKGSPARERTDLHDVQALAGALGHRCVVRTGGDVLCWGRGDQGETGLLQPVKFSRPAPVPGFRGWSATH